MQIYILLESFWDFPPDIDEFNYYLNKINHDMLNRYYVPTMLQCRNIYPLTFRMGTKARPSQEFLLVLREREKS